MSADSETKNGQRLLTARVFFALWPSAALAGKLAGVAREAAARWGGRPTRCDTIHLTLAFLGEVPVSTLPKLCALGECIRSSPFSLNIDRLDYWPRKRLFWAGLSETPECLRDLHRHLQAALSDAGFPADPPGREFTPHITMVRRVPAASDEPFRAGACGIGPLSWPCTSFVLVRSDLRASGPEYIILREFSLS